MGVNWRREEVSVLHETPRIQTLLLQESGPPSTAGIGGKHSVGQEPPRRRYGVRRKEDGSGVSTRKTDVHTLRRKDFSLGRVEEPKKKLFSNLSFFTTD